MPLNTTNLLVSQGWEGVGVPLDGKAGKGLKKPLAITQKKTLSGIGKDRDRADDWWNSIFTAGAKSLSIGPSPASSGTSTPNRDKSKTSSGGTSWTMGERSAASTTMSLSSLAKREHARKTLMSNFVRGKPILPPAEPTVDTPEPSVAASSGKLDEIIAASHAEIDAALVATSSPSTSALGPPPEPNFCSSGSGKDAETLVGKLAIKALGKRQGPPDDSLASPLVEVPSSALTARKSKKRRSSDEEKKSKKLVTAKGLSKALRKEIRAKLEEPSSTSTDSKASPSKKRKRDRPAESADSSSISVPKKQKKEKRKKKKVKVDSADENKRKKDKQDQKDGEKKRAKREKKDKERREKKVKGEKKVEVA